MQVQHYEVLQIAAIEKHSIKEAHQGIKYKTLTRASLRHAIDPRGSRFVAEHLQPRRMT